MQGDIIEGLLGMAQIRAINSASNDGTMDDTTPVTISYFADEIKRILSLLPLFSSITK